MEKGIEELIVLVSKENEADPNSQCVLNISGCGTEEECKKLASEVREKIISHRVLEKKEEELTKAMKGLNKIFEVSEKDWEYESMVIKMTDIAQDTLKKLQGEG